MFWKYYLGFCNSKSDMSGHRYENDWSADGKGVSIHDAGSLSGRSDQHDCSSGGLTIAVVLTFQEDPYQITCLIQVLFLFLWGGKSIGRALIVIQYIFGSKP